MLKAFQIKTVLINILTTLVLATLLELALGYGLQKPRFIPKFLLKHFQAYYNSEDRSILQVTDCATYDSQLYYQFIPGTCDFKNREFDVINNINSAGLRDDEGSLLDPSIVILGDSYTMGWGVEQTESYPYILEGLSKEKVLNAGVSSFGTAREMILWKKLNIKNVRTVIIQYHSNDFDENRKCLQNKFRLPISSQKSYDSLKENIADRNRYFPFKYLAGISKSIVLTMLSPKAESVANDTVQANTFLNILLSSGLNKVATRVFVFKIDRYENTDLFVDAVDYLLKDPRYSALNIHTVRINGMLKEEDFFILDAHARPSGYKKLAAKLNYFLTRDDAPVVADNMDAP